MMQAGKSVVSLFVVALMGLGALSVTVGNAHAAVAGYSGPMAQCSHYYPDPIGNVSVSANPTNVTVTWTTPQALTDTLYWGNSSNPYPFHQSASPPLRHYNYSVFLDFLEPNTTYHFEIVAPAYKLGTYCVNYANYTGSWSTGSDQSFVAATIHTYGASYIYGTVVNTTGAPAPAGVVVVASCVHRYILSNGNPWWNYGTTDSKGQYWVWIPPEYDSWTSSNMDICQSDVSPQHPGEMAYQVCVDNTGAWNDSYCGASSRSALPAGTVWPGYWNETMLTWAPQVVDFALPANMVSGPVVQIADFSNANTSNGFPNSHMGYTKTVHYTDTTSACSVILGFIQYQCTTSTFNSVASASYSVTGSNLIVTQRYWVTGSTVFDVFTRGVNVTSFNYYKTDAAPVLEGPSFSVSYAINPTTNGSYPLYYWGGSGSGGGVKAYSGSPKTGSVTVNATHYSNWTNPYDLTAEVPVGEIAAVIVGFITGVEFDWQFDVLVPIYSYSFAERAVASYSTAFNWTLYGNSATVPVCYAIYGVGGTTSASSTTIDAIGIWAYDPSYSGGQYSCPLP
jgi:hypothetical protein